MQRVRSTLWLLAIGLAAFGACPITHAADGSQQTIIYDGVPTQVKVSSGASSADLWISEQDLTRATKFVIKPQGICREELCFPVPANRKREFFEKKSSTTWFNLSEFARLLKQPVARDEKNSVWYFGPRPDLQNGYVSSLQAPDFTLPDVDGKMHSLSQFRGKKVFVLTWSSW